MGDLIRIVDSITASPTVLFDLNDEDPCGVKRFDATPPQLLRSTVQTQLRDGATDAGSVYGDRVLEVEMDLFAASQDTSATSLQNLARLLSDPRGQWLMYKPTGATSPVFFRTKRADISSIEDVLSSDALRLLDLSIPAEPFAYGLPVTGSAAIANNPTAGTNPMAYEFPAIQGDVAAPLSVKLVNQLTTSDNATGSLFATTAGPDAPSTPFWSDSSSWTLAADTGGFSHTTVTGGWAGGSALRYDTTADGSQIVANAVDTGVKPGDYRVMFRGLIDPLNIGGRFTVALSRSGSSAKICSRTLDGVPGGAQWFDLGLIRLPIDSPIDSPIMGVAPATATKNVRLTITLKGTTRCYLDALLFIPAGMDTALDTRVAMVARPISTAAVDLYLDAVREQAFATTSTSPPAYRAGTRIIGGGFLRVVPGTKNVLTFLRNYEATTASGGDSLLATTTVAWSYFPQYLNVRPATT